MDRKGFTLIELMVVIAIILILAAMVIPVFMKYRNNMNTTSENEIVIENETNEKVQEMQEEINRLRKQLKEKSNDKYGDGKSVY